jgi:hypothetical protein
MAVLLVAVGASGGYAASVILEEDSQAPGQQEPSTISDIEAANAAETAASDSPKWLLVMTAGRGTLDGTTLEVADPHHTVTAFTDRPVRDTAIVDLETFLGYWEEGETFDDETPNAALEMITDGGRRETVVVDLLSVERSGKTLSFEVAELGDQTVTGSFDEATFLIDDVTIAKSISSRKCPPDAGGCLVLPRLQHLPVPFNGYEAIQNASNQLALFGHGEGMGQCGTDLCYDLATVIFVNAQSQLSFSDAGGGDCSRVSTDWVRNEPDQFQVNLDIWQRSEGSIGNITFIDQNQWGLVNHSDQADCFVIIQGTFTSPD